MMACREMRYLYLRRFGLGPQPGELKSGIEYLIWTRRTVDRPRVQSTRSSSNSAVWACAEESLPWQEG
jgi:hypothetical protein